MIEGGWNFVWAAYAVTGAGLATLATIVLARLIHWSRQARALGENKAKTAP